MWHFVRSCRKEGFYPGCFSLGVSGPGEGKIILLLREAVCLVCIKSWCLRNVSEQEEKQALAQTGSWVGRFA